MNETLSQRLVEQRIRNRLMEEAWRFTHGDEGVRLAGPVEYFEGFFDWFGGRSQIAIWDGLSTLTPQEDIKIRGLLAVVGAAYDEWDLQGKGG